MNSVIILFVMEIDEKIFSALVAANENWAKHAAESEELASTSESSGSGDRAQAALNGNDLVKMKDDIALQRTQIAAQGDKITAQEEQMLKQFKTKGKHETTFDVTIEKERMRLKKFLEFMAME